MIRKSVFSDAPAMIWMAENFHNACTPDFMFSRLHAARSLHAALNSTDALCLTLDINGPKGALILHKTQYPMGPDILVKEAIFWIEPAFRGRWWRQMVRAAVDWSHEIGASHIGMSCFADGRTVKIFEREGFQVREVVAIRSLK